jgi:RimJ/RimL family protein N-acetyltransferase
VTEVGYWIAPWARGRGIATEMTGLVAWWALGEQRFARVELRAATGNLASQRVAAKAGLRRAGVLCDVGLTYDGRVDPVLKSVELPCPQGGFAPTGSSHHRPTL